METGFVEGLIKDPLFQENVKKWTDDEKYTFMQMIENPQMLENAAKAFNLPTSSFTVSDNEKEDLRKFLGISD